MILQEAKKKQTQSQQQIQQKIEEWRKSIAISQPLVSQEAVSSRPSEGATASAHHENGDRASAANATTGIPSHGNGKCNVSPDNNATPADLPQQQGDNFLQHTFA